MLAPLALWNLVPLLLARAPAAGGSLHYGFSLSLQPVIALIAGVLILIRPRLLNFIVAIYLIIVGLTGLFSFSW